MYSVEEHLNPQVLVQSDDWADYLKYSISQFSFHSLFGQMFANFKSVPHFCVNFGEMLSRHDSCSVDTIDE